ncbi:hypothetical protein E8L99_23500 [Phreatobacter aquaticus]|uniref:PBP domain-containing protein n=1 Tax=Phreatobacter aquaticus TaxID=2570229 RepID=A0A4D7QRA6_9HYPH|nr:hypothetical protein [Phreatobacter aquaticus]QCK88513.1 hypothetical protein E8L99_23500 [Phreatobacter aquaticus]
MRKLFFWLAMFILAGPAAAQGSGKLTPLPGGPALLDWVRSTLAEALDGVTQIEPGRSPSVFIARTGSPDLPVFNISVVEQMPSEAPETMTKGFISSFRASCGPLRLRGHLSENELYFEHLSIECPGITASGLYLWILAYKDSDRTQLIALSGSLAATAAINARGEKLAAALGLRIYPTSRSLTEAVAVAQAFFGTPDDYELSAFTSLGGGRGRLRVKEMILTGKPGAWEVNAPSCSAIRVREIEDGPPTSVSSDSTIDLQRLAALVKRQGPDLITSAGAYGTRTILASSPRPVTSPLALESGSLSPASANYAQLDSLLVAWERFCASATPVKAEATQAPAGSSTATASAASMSQPAPAAPAPSQVAQAAPGQPGAAPQRACDREGSRTNIARGRTSGVIDEPSSDARGPFLSVDAAWWRSVSQSFRQDMADIVHCASGRWGTPLALRILDRTTRAEIGIFAAGNYRAAP